MNRYGQGGYGFFTCMMAIGFLLIFCTTSMAQGEHARRAGAQLQVISGDAARLVKEPKMLPAQRKGLEERLRGAFAGLPLLLRLADQERGLMNKIPSLMLKQFAARLASNQPGEVVQIATELIKKYPLLLPRATGSSARARTIHDEYCAACHDDPDLSVERPAFNLFKQAKRQSSVEFLARMIIGIRGDRVTGYSNPLNDAELSSLVTLYRTVKN